MTLYKHHYSISDDLKSGHLRGPERIYIYTYIYIYICDEGVKGGIGGIGV